MKILTRPFFTGKASVFNDTIVKIQLSFTKNVPFDQIYVCSMPLKKQSTECVQYKNKDNLGHGDFVVIALHPQPKIPSRDLLAQNQQWKHESNELNQLTVKTPK